MRRFLIFIFVIASTMLRSESILRILPLPGYSNGYFAYGLAFDGTYLWVGDDYDGMIYKMDTLGNVVGSFMGIPGSNHGLAWDGSGLWCAGGYSSNHIIKFDSSGTRIDSVAENWQYIGGLGYDGSHLLVTVYYPNTVNNVYFLDPVTGQVVDTVPSPGTQPQGVTFDGQYIWVVMDDNDGDPERVWKIDPLTGDTLMSFPVPTTSPRGLAWGGNCLWLIARNSGGAGCAVFQIDPYGEGVPEITLNTNFCDFGDVIVGTAETLLIVCTNTGNGYLIIDSTTNSNTAFTVNNTFPISLQPAYSCSLYIIFSPSVSGTYTDVLSIYSNDPLHPIVSVTLQGNGIYAGQDIHLPDTIISWENMRTGGSKRKWLSIMNVGSNELRIDSVKFSTDIFRTTKMFPVFVNPSSQMELDVWFAPTIAGTYQETLYIYSNDPDEEVILVNLIGNCIDTTFVGGDIIWYYQARGGIVYNHIRSIKSIPDVNGDGKDDAVAVSENDTLYLIHGNGYQEGDVLWRFADKTCYTERGLVVVPDLNEDGFSDVILGAVWGSRKVYTISGKDGSVIWQYDTHQYGGGGWVYEVSYAPDLDGDGKVEILAATGDDGYNTGPKRVFMFSGATGNILWQRYLGYPVFSVRTVGDINNDGYPEVAAGTADGGSYAYWVNLLNGVNGIPIWSKNLGGAVWTVVPIQDINNDGFTDIAAGLGSGEVVALSGADGSLLWMYTTGGIVTDLNFLDDVNGNGHCELLPSGAAVPNFTAIDSRSGAPVWNFPSGDAAFSMVAIPDVNGDGYPDVIGGTGYTVNRLVLISGVNGDVIWNKDMPSAVESVFPIGDVDGDGTFDILAGLRNGDILCIASGYYSRISETVSYEHFEAWLSQQVFTNTAFLNLSLFSESRVEIDLFDITGRWVIRAFDEKLDGGVHKISFDLSALKAGVYFARVKTAKGSTFLRVVKIW